MGWGQSSTFYNIPAWSLDYPKGILFLRWITLKGIWCVTSEEEDRASVSFLSPLTLSSRSARLSDLGLRSTVEVLSTMDAREV